MGRHHLSSSEELETNDEVHRRLRHRHRRPLYLSNFVRSYIIKKRTTCEMNKENKYNQNVVRKSLIYRIL